MPGSIHIRSFSEFSDLEKAFICFLGLEGPAELFSVIQLLGDIVALFLSKLDCSVGLGVWLDLVLYEVE
ncbi:hypothetical protein C493_07244 [Natronolimnohabitans innermongolicus JCM 12255]|uniref:Uncharacterized protein n=1 Tax=Natronolimnohabitans innermongolicus JCM 12255 TaxID=1227499 RepID=L9X9R5_9EURY|nr:hypothetical protein C493_07244 [Natronolimnohabitans innermongolicus JCM 12255]